MRGHGLGGRAVLGSPDESLLTPGLGSWGQAGGCLPTLWWPGDISWRIRSGMGGTRDARTMIHTALPLSTGSLVCLPSS